MPKRVIKNPVLKEKIEKAKERQEQIKAQAENPKPTPGPAGPGKKEEDIIIKSSTPGSKKKFKLMVDDSGTITVSEVK